MIQKLRSLAVGSLIAVNSAFASLETVIHEDDAYASITHYAIHHQANEVPEIVRSILLERTDITPYKEFIIENLRLQKAIAIDNLNDAKTQNYSKIFVEGVHRVPPSFRKVDSKLHERIYGLNTSNAFVLLHGRAPKSQSEFTHFLKENYVFGGEYLVLSTMRDIPVFNVDIALEDLPGVLHDSDLMKDPREDLVMENMIPYIKRGDNIALFFGSMHDFENQIRAYNIRYPEYKLNFRVFLSDSIKKYEDKNEDRSIELVLEK